MGLQGKFLVALLVAGALPFLSAMLVLETVGFRYLLAERGRLHQLESMTLGQAIIRSSAARAEQFQTWLTADPGIGEFVAAANATRAALPDDQAAARDAALEQRWQNLAQDDPAVRAILGNPASGNLARFRAPYPAVAEILVTDSAGVLVAATGMTSDIIQSDEGWWKAGAKLPPRGHFTGTLDLDESSGVFSCDIVVPVHHRGEFAGLAKLTEDISTLFTRIPFDGEQAGERWYIVLADSRILASSEPGYQSLSRTFNPKVRGRFAAKQNGWMLGDDPDGGKRMMGFTALSGAEDQAAAHVVFSSRSAGIVGPLREKLLWCAAGGALLLAGCTWAGYLMIRRSVLDPLASLGRAARSISASARLKAVHPKDEIGTQESRRHAEDDLKAIQAIHTGDEVEALAADVAVMTSRVLRYHRELEAEVAAKTSVIREDLEMARQFQQALLPSHYPVVPPEPVTNPLRLAFAHFYQPASTVGGDYFDIIELDDNRAGILIADVMGHGARSALITAILRALVRNLSAEVSAPGEFLRELNRHFHDVIDRSGQTLFVTAFLLVLDTRQGKASWAVAGHPAPLRVRRGSGKPPQPLWTESQKQPALGLVPDFPFRSHELPLAPGDVFFLHTDGVFEAENPEGEPFGLDRLIMSFDQALDGPIAAMPAQIVRDVVAFQRRNQCDDDICVVAVEALSPRKP